VGVEMKDLEMTIDNVKIPFTKDELEGMIEKIHTFSVSCGKWDSLGRVYACVDLERSIARFIKEENLHSFKFPSPNNPSVGDLNDS